MRLPTTNVTPMARAPRASWRRPARNQGHRRDPQGRAQHGQAEQVGQQRHQGADREGQQRRSAGQHRGRQLLGVHAEFFAGVDPQRCAGVTGDRGGHPGRGIRIGAVLAEVARQLVLLGRREPGQHLALQGHLGVHQLVLVRHRDVLPGAHRERSRHQRRRAGQHDRVRGHPAAAQPRDQRCVRDQAVHRAEHGGPQPAAGYVTVTVRPAGHQRCRPCRIGRLAPVLVSHQPDQPPRYETPLFVY